MPECQLFLSTKVVQFTPELLVHFAPELMVHFTPELLVHYGPDYTFMNRNLNVMKILHMEYAGLVIYHKKLESGRFKLPVFDENTTSITIHWHDLMTIVQSVKTGCGKLRRIVNKYQTIS